MSKFNLSIGVIACIAAFGGQAYAAIPEGSATGWASIAIGEQSTSGGEGGGGVSIGYNTQTLTAGVAIGNNAHATGNRAVAVGFRAESNVEAGLALGDMASVTTGGGIALGAKAVAERASRSFGNDSEGQALTEAVSFGNVADKTTPVWTSVHGVASIGSDSVTRQLTGVAAGSQDNDAVNVAQLKSLQQSSVFGSGASNMITPANNDDPDNPVRAEYAENAAVFGNNAKVLVNNGVAIGANSVASTVGRTATSPYVAGGATVETSNGGAWASEGLVSFGYTETTGEGDGATYVTHNRTLTGVAAGSEDNDAVNVAQLKQLESNTATQLSDLMSGKQQVSEIQLLARDELGNPIVNADGKSETIGLRYQVAAAEPAALADGDSGTATQSQGRLIYNNLDATGKVIGTETVATLNDGINISVGKVGSEAREGEAAPVKVDLNKGISFLTDGEYLSANVASDNNGGAVVTFSTTQALKDALANAGGNTGGNTGGDSGNSGNTGGSGWTPSQAQLAAMNGNFANGITVAPGEGNQAIQIKQGNVDMGGNRIQNVGNPINDGDAANKAYVDSTSRSLRNKINDVDKDLRAGVAMAMAVGNLPQAYMPGKSIVGLSAGTYHGQGGFALGLSHATENRQWILKGAASVDTRGNFGGTLSAGYQF